jgi:hypothetical protein
LFLEFESLDEEMWRFVRPFSCYVRFGVNRLPTYSLAVPAVSAVHSLEADRTLQEFSALSLQQLESDAEDEFLASNRSSANGFVTPHKQPDSSAPEQDLDAAIDNSDFGALEKLGLKLALLARMGDLAGIKRIAGQTEFTRNSFGSFKSRDENMFQGPSTSSSQFSTPETVVAVPSSPISPHLGMSEYYPSKSFENRTSFSTYITSVKTGTQGISAERVSCKRYCH